MPGQRPRRTTPRPQNMGQNRNVQMRNNARRGGPTFSPNQMFQGGLGQNPSVAPAVQPPGVRPPGGQQGATQCPAGQKPGRTPDGRMGCVPDVRAGAPGAPGASPARRPGAGTPNRSPRPPLKEGY